MAKSGGGEASLKSAARELLTLLLMKPFSHLDAFVRR